MRNMFFTSLLIWHGIKDTHDIVLENTFWTLVLIFEMIVGVILFTYLNW